MYQCKFPVQKSQAQKEIERFLGRELWDQSVTIPELVRQIVKDGKGAIVAEYVNGDLKIKNVTDKLKDN